MKSPPALSPEMAEGLVAARPTTEWWLELKDLGKN